MESQKLTGLKKRQQIQMAGRTMFIWVAVAAVAVSLALVALQFLFKQWSFNQKVIDAKVTASTTLSKNIENASELKTNVNALLGNPELSSARQPTSANNLQVVLDALPSTLDVTALATSIQQVIVPRSGAVIESLTMPQQGTSEEEAEIEASADDGPIEQRFTLVVTGNYASIRSLTDSLEKSIRPMKVITMNVGGSDQALKATLDVVTYYQPAKTVTIEKKAVR